MNKDEAGGNCYGYQKDQAEKEVVDWETRNEYRW